MIHHNNDHESCVLYSLRGCWDSAWRHRR